MEIRPSYTSWLLLQIGAGAVRSAAFSTHQQQSPIEQVRRRPHLQSHVTEDAYDVNVPILYENDKLLAVAKPPHISHHDDESAPGILSIIRHQQQQPNPSFPYPHRLYGVHRLDKVTSGILLLAKDSATASTLMTKFSNKEIKKYYMAISGKKPKKKKQGWVKGEMVMGRRGSYKLLNASGPGKGAEGDGDDWNAKKNVGYAVTRFFTAGLGNLHQSPPLMERAKDVGDDDRPPVPKTAILFQPHTGKTHQLRVAAKSLGLPILGDVRYSGGSVEAPMEGSDGDNSSDDWNRTYLHSCAIHLQLDEDVEVTIWSPPPFDHLFAPNELNDVFVGMMEKHCDCPPILDAIHKAGTIL